MDLTMEHLERCFLAAKEKGAKFVASAVKMEGFPKNELIVNQHENIDSKLAYYKATYDENLNHKFAKGISIFGVTYGDSLAELDGIVF